MRREKGKQLNQYDKINMIYELMIGVLDLEQVNDPLVSIITDESEGEFYSKKLNRIYTLKSNLNKRLHEEDDAEVQELLDSYEDICKYLCIKMFQYGQNSTTKSSKVEKENYNMKTRKTGSDCRVGTFEKKHGLPPGAIRNKDGRDTRSDKKIGTLRKEALVKK